jgi:hypothetical protein
MRGKRLIFQLVTIVFTVSLLLVVIGLVLRVRPTLFGHQLGSYVFSRYGHSPGDLYFYDREVGMNLMWPDFETRAYYNGWFWKHRTDERGFRNPTDREAEVLLLGDSMIYGHGVELDEGVSEVLHDRYGWSTYNLSQQGDSAYQAYAKTRLYVDELMPHTVVHFAFYNDGWGLEVDRSTEQIEAMPELTRDDWKSLRARIREQGGQRREPWWFDSEPAFGFFNGLVVELEERIRRRSESDLDSKRYAALQDPERRARIQRFYDRLLPDLAERVAARGARLIVIHLDPAAGLSEDDRVAFREVVARASELAGVPFFDTGEGFAECTDCLLADDGHLNATGHAVLAELVDGWLRELDDPGVRRSSVPEPGR